LKFIANKGHKAQLSYDQFKRLWLVTSRSYLPLAILTFALPLALVFVPALLKPPTTLAQQEIDSCNGKNAALDAQITGCTDLIGSGKLSTENLAKAYDYRGIAYSKQSNWEKASADFGEAIRVNPSLAEAYNNRGFFYASVKKDYDRAIADYNEALRLLPNDSQALRNRGLALLAKHEFDPAIADYTKAIQINPKDVASYVDRGNVYHAQHDLDRAIADFDEAIQIGGPNPSEAYSNRCYAYNDKGDYERALADCNEAIQLSAKNALAYLNRAVTYHFKGDPVRMEADFENAVKINPAIAIEVQRVRRHLFGNQTDRG
jgi:tetratricopeptide (TPR) repeat protein